MHFLYRAADKGNGFRLVVSIVGQNYFANRVSKLFPIYFLEFHIFYMPLSVLVVQAFQTCIRQSISYVQDLYLDIKKSVDWIRSENMSNPI